MDILKNSVKENQSRPPLRWIANTLGNIGSWSILKLALLDEDEKYGWQYKMYGVIHDLTWPVYRKYGTFYKLDIDLSGAGWDDYDENGIPYWEKWEDWDFEDYETGDAFRIIKK